ncbi:MAG: DNA repair protein RecO [Candidatus Staskawiczbacteria bacterium]|nr:DNA repair protein RecO [Candidatus Staskawiczbacteria bacterium]
MTAIYYRTGAFVFRKKDVFEADRVFSVFSDEFGKLEVIGRAIRKITSKLRGGIEIFSLSEIEFVQGKNLKTLTDTVSLEKFGNIAQDPNKLEISGKIADVLDNFIKGQEKDELIFALLRDVFSKLNDAKLKTFGVQLVYHYFLWNFFSLAGYHPEIQKCAACQMKLSPDIIYFSNKEGGIICKNCSSSDIKAKKINSDIVKMLKLILKKDWHILSRLKVGDFSQKLLKEVSDNYYHYILPSH